VSRARGRLGLLAGAALLQAACETGFETKSIVLDLRVLAMRGDPAEVVVDVDPDDLLAVELPPVTVTALIADPAGPRALTFRMTACPETFALRCDAGRVAFALPFAAGETDSPELSGVLQPNLPLLSAAFEEDEFLGLGGIPVVVELVVSAPDGQEVSAGKRVTFAPRVPAGRRENQNPTLAGLLARGEPFDDGAPLLVAVREEVRLEPVEPDGAREVYVVPTLDGGERTFTENLRYSWLATAGSFSRETTGGATDLFGNEPVLWTRWRAPDHAGDVTMWVVQRDERGGASWTTRILRVQ
jgi:hypothetical protein